MAITVRRNYVGVQITLTSADTTYNVWALVNAIIAAESANSGGVEAMGTAREFNIQADPGIDGAAGNTNDILVGDGLVSTTRYGYLLKPGDSRNYRSSFGNVQVSDIFVQSHGSSQKLNVEIMG